MHTVLLLHSVAHDDLSFCCCDMMCSLSLAKLVPVIVTGCLFMVAPVAEVS